MVPSNDGVEKIEPVLIEKKQPANHLEDYYNYKNKRLKYAMSKNETLIQAGKLLKKLKFSVVESIERGNSMEQAYEKFSDLILEKLRKLIKK